MSDNQAVDDVTRDTTAMTYEYEYYDDVVRESEPAVNWTLAEAGLGAMEPWQTASLALLAAGVSLITICGNLIVLLSFILERSIRQPSNYFIASLAVSDLLIGTCTAVVLSTHDVAGLMFLPLCCVGYIRLTFPVEVLYIFTRISITYAHI